MKQLAVAGIACLLTGMAPAQSVNDLVRFDTYSGPGNNDLVNNFSNTTWIQMVTSNGITGGALQPPDSISWGNDVITYCRKEDNVVDSLVDVSICFRYNSSMVAPSAFQRAADIWLFSNVVNHWIIFSVNYNQHLTVLSYFTANDTLLTLTNSHWYRLTASYKSLSTAPGDWVYARAEAFDLGITGTDPPTSIGHETVTFQDIDMVQSDLDIKVSGARYGGGEWLDDFAYHGIPSQSTCVLTGISSLQQMAWHCYPQPVNRTLTVENQGNTLPVQLLLTDMCGRQVFRAIDARLPFRFDIGYLPAGVYALECRTAEAVVRRTIVKSDP